MKFLADDTQQIFGTINPPSGMDIGKGDPIAAVGKVIGTVINLFIVIAGLTLLTFLLWGALDWITSGGEKEKVQKAQNKITNAVIGILLIFAVIIIFGYLAGDILGIVKRGSTGWELKIPTL
jgi:amino acid transporter